MLDTALITPRRRLPGGRPFHLLLASLAACTARFVPDAELQRANALRAAIGQGAIVAGPALGALALAVSGPAVAIALNAVTFVVSAARAPRRCAGRPRRSGSSSPT